MSTDSQISRVYKALKAASYRWAAYFRYSWKIRKVPPEFDLNLVQAFEGLDLSNHSRVEMLNKYFIGAFLWSSNSSYTRAYYPGLHSCNGCDIDAIEGFSRMSPLMATVVSRENFSFCDPKGTKFDLRDVLRKAFLSGTDPVKDGYWGDIKDFDQRTAEAADIALAIWISRDQIWSKLTAVERKQITEWLKQALDRKVVDNNWHLFPYLISLILFDLGESVDIQTDRLERVKSFHVGNGWFKDGPNGDVDYYNAWAFHYSFFWIELIGREKEEVTAFFTEARKSFTESYKTLFTPSGVPLFGRSLCYRFAVSAPLLASVLRKDGVLNLGMVIRSFADSWDNLIHGGAIRNGVPSQGVITAAPDLLDNYSGPASSLWGLRSLVLANLLKVRDVALEHESMNSQYEIELGDFEYDLPGSELRLVGKRRGGEIFLCSTGCIKIEGSQKKKVARRFLIKSWLMCLSTRVGAPSDLYFSSHSGESRNVHEPETNL